jgi:hypothetical protein
MRRTLGLSLATGLLLLVPALVRAEDDAATKAIIEKAIKAHGGKENLTKYLASTTTLKGKVHVMGMDLDYTMEFWVQMPDKLKYVLEFEIMGQKLKITQVTNGDKGWATNPMDNSVMELSKEIMDEVKEQMYHRMVDTLAPLTGKEYTLAPLGDNKVGDRPVVGIKVSHKGHRDVNLFFDKDTHLLLKAEAQIKDVMAGGQEMMQETIYSNYKDSEGIKVPTKLLIKRDGKDFVDGEATEFKAHEKLDDSIFVKP